MAGAKWFLQLPDNSDQAVNDRVFVLQIEFLANRAEDFVELHIGNRTNFNFGLNATQKCGVNQRSRIQVGGKDHKHLERNLHLLAAGERQEVDSAIQWNHPPVKQFFGTKPLPSKVVDDQHSVVGLHLHGRCIELCDRVHMQLEHLDGEFAANQDRRSMAQNPTLITGRRIGSRQRSMYVWVVQGDDLAIYFDCVRNAYPIESEHVGQGSRNAGLAGAAWTVQENRRSRIQGRPQFVQRLAIHHQMSEGALNFGRMDLRVAYAL